MLSFLSFISFYIQYEEVHVFSIVVILINNKSLAHNNFDNDCKGGVLVQYNKIHMFVAFDEMIENCVLEKKEKKLLR